MNMSSASNLSTQETVCAIMAAKTLDVIVGQPTTQTMNLMTEQMAKMTAAVRTTSYGGKNGCLALVLNDADYRVVTGNNVSSTDLLETPKGAAASLTD